MAAPAAECLVFFGTYTGVKSKGIYACRLDTGSGRLSDLALAAEIESPSFLAIHPKGQFLYAVNETASFSGERTGAVTAFAVSEQSRTLRFLNQQPSGGRGPCHLEVDRSGNHLLVANYGGGSVAVLPIAGDGRLGKPTRVLQHKGASVNPQRQEGPHAHCVNLDPQNRFAYVADLGLDKVMIYRFDPAQGILAENEPPWGTVKPGAGPRHLAFHPHRPYVYVINELDSTLTAFARDRECGGLASFQTVTTLPSAFAGQSTTAEVEAHPNGQYLYGSNRGHDSIAVFTIDAQTGRLTLVEHEPTQGRTPRNFAIDPTGRYLLAANQDSNNVAVFQIDSETGRLQPTGQVLEVPMPVCIRFLPR